MRRALLTENDLMNIISAGITLIKIEKGNGSRPIEKALQKCYKNYGFEKTMEYWEFIARFVSRTSFNLFYNSDNAELEKMYTEVPVKKCLSGRFTVLIQNRIVELLFGGDEL